MRHAKRVKKLGRKSQHRKAMLRNLTTSLIKHERIVTTVQKAKALRAVVEPIITRARKANKVTEMEKVLHHKREVLKKIKDRSTIVKLFEDIALRYMDRDGGYTRIYKLGNRKGDNAEMALIELVEEQLDTTKKSTTKTKSTKTKIGKVEKTTKDKPKAKATKTTEKKAEEKVEEKAEETPKEKPETSEE